MMTIIHQEENRSNSCGFGGRGSVCRNLFLAASVLDVPANPTAPFALSVPKGANGGPSLYLPLPKGEIQRGSNGYPILTFFILKGKALARGSAGAR